MRKYKQTFIPEALFFPVKTEQELKQAIKTFYKEHIQGQTIINKDVATESNGQRKCLGLLEF